MKIIDVSDISTSYTYQLPMVVGDTPQVLGELRVAFVTSKGEEMNSSPSNVITALRKYLDDQPLPQ